MKQIDWEDWSDKQVLGARVAVRVEWSGSQEAKTVSGLHLPDQAAPPPTSGTVVAVGSGVQEDIKVGDVIHFGQLYGSALFKSAQEKRPGWFILRSPEETQVRIRS